MVFSSEIFLFAFLPAFLLLYFLSPSSWKNVSALIASYFFYAWGAPKVVVILFISTVADYYFSHLIQRSEKGSSSRKLLLAASLGLNLSTLLYFKYANFFIEQSNTLLSSFGQTPFSWSEVLLPIGISFFTFQKLSYLIDVYRGTVSAATRFVDYALYVALFPQLIAGPIVRYHDLAEQLRRREHSLSNAVEGIYRFTLGLGKKVLIANEMGEVADRVFDLPLEALPLTYAWVGITAYAFHIYFDFSGYSDMAIGLGRVMGFRFLENFDRPYIAQSFTEFWRRWHISLSRWMKEYLYIPLGGNRGSALRTYSNLWIVFLLSGLWHGASWTFVVWGAYHGFFLTLDKMFMLRVSKRLPAAINTLMTFLLVVFSWVIFRSETLSEALGFAGCLLDFAAIGQIKSAVFWADIIGSRERFVFVVAAIISFFPMAYLPKFEAPHLPAFSWKAGVSLTCLLLSVVALANSQFNPFIYFKF